MLQENSASILRRSISESFRCDPCTLHLSDVTLRTPGRSPVRPDGLVASAGHPPVTLDAPMNQLKHSAKATDELRN